MFVMMLALSFVTILVWDTVGLILSYLKSHYADLLIAFSMVGPNCVLHNPLLLDGSGMYLSPATVFPAEANGISFRLE
jgi:hypothetical protein